MLMVCLACVASARYSEQEPITYLKGIAPMLTFETPRLLLRRFVAEDAPALHREIYSDPDILTYYNGGRVFTPAEVEAIVSKRTGKSQLGYWAVTRREDDQLLGQVHLDAYVNAGWYEIPEDAESPFQHLEAHLGFVFGKRFWGNGYAEEACRPLIGYAFADLRLRRLVGGANVENVRSVRLHERLGFRLFPSPDGTGVTAVLDNPLADYTIRPYREEDRTGAEALGTHVIGWWHQKGAETSLHLVAAEKATGAIVGHLQAVDHSVPEPTRRPGQCHFVLEVAPAHRQRGIGGALYAQAAAFARRQKARLLYAAYLETEDAPAATFLKKRGFEVLERFYPSTLDLTSFDPAPFQSAVERVRAQGIGLQTYADLGDSAENRRKLYELEQAARATQPFREVEPYVPEPYAKWEQNFLKRDPTMTFLAIAPPSDAWAGVVWYFTGVHPDWRGRGIATALKVLCAIEAKKRGLNAMETENHGDNLPMLAINRKLGFHFTTPEVACIKRFG